MTAAGVQNLDSAAYMPPPPSPSTSDAKGSSPAGKQAADSQAAGAPGEPSDFQSELAQQTGQPEADQTGSTQTGSTKASAAKTGSGKTGKKRDTRADAANSSAATPVQVAEPQKPILPFSLALPQPQPQENANLDQNAEPSEKATPDATAQGPAQQSAQALSASLAAVALLPELRQPVALKQPMKSRQSAQPVESPAKPTSASNTAPPTATEPGKVEALPLAPVPAAIVDIPVRPEVQKPEAPASQDQARSQGNQSVSLAGFRLPASPAEPPAASGVQETANSAPASPSAMAFAARISAAQQAQQKADQPVPIASAQSSAISGSQTPDQIPMRHAATAQIIPSAALGTEQDGPKKDAGKDAGLAIDKFVRPDTRTDMVLPRFEASSEPAPSSASQSPQQAAPAARPETIIEPPAAPPTSPHDIRVRVPDNNGGSTQVRFVESGGEVRVSVRTADDGLAQNLRTHLNDLTQRLSDGGMPAEIWKPVSNSSSSQNDQQPSHQDGRGSGGQGSGGQSGQQDRQQQRPAWLEEMEASLHGEQN